MRHLIAFLISLVIIIYFFGCSGKSDSPTSPNEPESDSSAISGNQSVLYSGTLTIDPVNLTIENVETRNPDWVYNITPFLGNQCPGGCFRFKIVGIVGTVLEIELTIENPAKIQVYDVRVEYIELFGKTVVNPDSYTDYLGVPITKVKPFTAFATDNPNRAFPVGPSEWDTQTLFLDFPPGSIAAVNYAITASFPGMTGEPYEINGMNQEGDLTPTGGTATISCHVLDHQADISSVYLDARPFVGGPVAMNPDPIDPSLYKVEIGNTQGAPVGTYNQLIVAQSPNQQNIKTYNFVAITVIEEIEKPIWPVLQGNRGHTGMVGLNGPQNIHDAYSWKGIYPPGWNYYGNPLPVFLSEDTIFLSNTGDGGPLPCLAIDMTTHEVKWTQQFHDDMQNWLNLKCINEDGTVVLTHETGYNRLVGLDASDGSYMWEVPGSIKVDSYPTLDLDGNFIVPLENVGIISIRPSDGHVNWTSAIGDTYYSVPAVGENGVIYSTHGGQWSGDVVALDPSDGHLKWTSQSIGFLRGNATVVHPNGTILAHGGDGLFCFQDNGTSCMKLWSQTYACPFYASVGIGPTGDIFLLDWDGTLRRINPDAGVTVQSQPGWGDTGLSGNFVRMAVGADGLLYFAYYMYMDNESYFACANPDCTLRWRHYGGEWFMGDGLYSAPAIGQDGTVYSSYRKDGLVAWKD